MIVGGVEIFSEATGLVEAQEAVDEARRDALTDPLTGLPNRRLLDVVLASRQEDLDRRGAPYGFLIVDIDHFKHFNDTFGHDVGDQALKVVASTFKGACRTGDALVRWGREEFGVVAAHVDSEAIHRLADRLLRIVRSTHVPVGAGRFAIHVSIGGALGLPGEPLDALFARADQALLAAKRGVATGSCSTTHSRRERSRASSARAGRAGAPRQAATWRLAASRQELIDPRAPRAFSSTRGTGSSRSACGGSRTLRRPRRPFGIPLRDARGRP